jgi:hypothetical protein
MALTKATDRRLVIIAFQALVLLQRSIAYLTNGGRQTLNNLQLSANGFKLTAFSRRI